MRKTILPVNENPPIIGYLHHAYPLSILSVTEAYVPWFYSNFVQLISPKDIATNRNSQFDFYNKYFFFGYPQGIQPLKNQVIKRGLLSKNYTGGVKQFIIDCIDLGRYIYTWADEYDISSKISYQKNHVFHDVFIYGYDLENNCFYTLGFGTDMQFSSHLIPFEQLHSLEDTLDYWDIKIFVIERNDQFDDSSVDLSLLNIWLNDYLRSFDSSLRYKPLIYSYGLNSETGDLCYGLSVYASLMEYLESVKRGQSSLDIRPFHILWEHKKIMVERIKYMIDNVYIEDDGLLEKAEQLEKVVLSIRNLLLKHFIMKNDIPEQYIKEKLLTARGMDIDLIETFIYILSGKLNPSNEN